ncbi:unnamed protein product, partial [Ceratitis capitata]
ESANRNKRSAWNPSSRTHFFAAWHHHHGASVEITKFGVKITKFVQSVIECEKNYSKQKRVCKQNKKNETNTKDLSNKLAVTIISLKRVTFLLINDNTEETLPRNLKLSSSD